MLFAYTRKGVPAVARDHERLESLIRENGYTEMKKFSADAGVPYKTFHNILKTSKSVATTSHVYFKGIANALGMDSDTLYDILYKEE